MKLLHYTAADKPLLKIESQPEQSREGLLSYAKPRGLWLSVEGEHDWFWWCTSEEFGLRNLGLCYEVRLRPGARVLHLATVEELDAFTDQYASYHREMKKSWDAGFSEYMRRSGIRWDLVAQEHQGIIIAPYQWSRRLDDRTPWYYSWDCASGCVWDADAVASFELVEEEVAA